MNHTYEANIKRIEEKPKKKKGRKFCLFLFHILLIAGVCSYLYLTQYRTFNVTFVVNGVETVQAVTINKKADADKVPSIEKEGYTFIGWYFDGTDSLWTKTASASDKSVTKEIKVSPKYIANTYEVTFKLSDNYSYFKDNKSSKMTSQLIDFDSKIVTPVVENNVGYPEKVFDHWEAEDGTKITNGNTYTIANDITVNAVYKVRTTAVNYELNGGSKKSNFPSSFEYGKEYKLSSYVPTKTGYTFTGWSMSDISSWKKIDESVTLTASWEANETTVKLDSNNGSPIDYKTIAYNDEYELLEPEKVGYTFVGWYDESNTRYQAKGTWNYADDTLNLTAHWEKTEYKVTFSTIGKCYDLYKFNNNKVEDISFTIDGETELNATYNKKDDYYTVDLIGKNAITNVKDNAGENSKAKYEFAGWYTLDANGEFDKKWEAGLHIEGDTTLYAKFVIVEYTFDNDEVKDIEAGPFYDKLECLTSVEKIFVPTGNGGIISNLKKRTNQLPATLKTVVVGVEEIPLV